MNPDEFARIIRAGNTADQSKESKYKVREVDYVKGISKIPEHAGQFQDWWLRLTAKLNIASGDSAKFSPWLQQVTWPDGDGPGLSLIHI